MKKPILRILSVLLALILVAGYLPLPTSAEETDPAGAADPAAAADHSGHPADNETGSEDADSAGADAHIDPDADADAASDGETDEAYPYEAAVLERERELEREARRAEWEAEHAAASADPDAADPDAAASAADPADPDASADPAATADPSDAPAAVSNPDPATAAADGIPLTETYFPDANFRAFLKQYDANNDGALNADERCSVTEMDCHKKGIASLVGIKYFPMLKRLTAHTNELTSLDVSGLPALQYLYVKNNQLNYLGLTDNRELLLVECDGNNIWGINVSGLPKLNRLKADNNRISSLDVTGCSSLSTLFVNSNQLKSLDLSECTSLSVLHCYSNQLTKLDCSGAPALDTLECQNNPLTRLEISGCPALARLECQSTDLSYVDLRENPILLNLVRTGEVHSRDGYDYIQGDGYLAFNPDQVFLSDERGIPVTAAVFPDANFLPFVSPFDTDGDGFLSEAEIAAAESLDCSGYTIDSLEGIQYLTALKVLDCSHNALTELDLSRNTALKELYCNFNSLRSLDLSKNTDLWILNCGTNGIYSLIVPASLTTLSCGENSLSWDWSGYAQCPNLEKLEISNSGIQKLDLRYNPKLTRLVCEKCGLSKLDLSYTPNLAFLSCWGNKFKILDLRPAPALAAAAKTLTEHSDTIDNYGYALFVDPSTALILDDRGVPISDKLFPDATLRAALASRADGNGDGYLSDAEFGVTELDVSHCGITSLEGIQYFPNLKKLNCSSNALTEISGEVIYKMDPTWLDCSDNQLEDLYLVSSLLWLDCSGNKLYRDLRLDDPYCPDLVYLDFSDNQISADFCPSDSPHLKYVNCSGNSISGVNLKWNGELEEFYCSENRLKSLDVTACTSLRILDCFDNQLTSLNVSGLSELHTLLCSDNNLTTLDLSGTSGMRHLSATFNPLSFLDLRPMPYMVKAYTEGTPYSAVPEVMNYTYYNHEASEYFTLDVPNPFLLIADDTGVPIDASTFPDETFRTYINNFVDKNKDGFLQDSERSITEIDAQKRDIADLTGIAFFPKLTELICNDNQLTALDVSTFPDLEVLYCDYNQLTALDVSGNPKLTKLRLTKNQLTVLDVSQNPELIQLECGLNQLTSLSVWNNPALVTLSCSYNQLKELDVSYNPVLKNFYCGSNPIKSLDLTKNPKLKYFTCEETQVKKLDLSQNPELKELYCCGSPLTSLDLSDHPALDHLDCKNCGLTGLDLTGCEKLAYFNVYGNQLELLDLRPAPILADLVQTATLDTSNENFDRYKIYNADFMFDKGQKMITSGSGVPVDAAHFPDPTFRLYAADFDTDGNRLLSDAELAAATELYCSGDAISSLQGLEYFTSLQLLECYENNLTSLDLSKNAALTHLECGTNKLKTLDLSGTPNLDNLYCGDNKNLTVLDLRAAPKLALTVKNGTKTTVSGVDIYTLNTWHLSVDSSVTLICEGDGVPIIPLYFPDPKFRTIVSQYDGNTDGWLSAAELAAVTEMTIETDLDSMVGIGWFTSLQVLNLDGPDLWDDKALDLSRNTALRELSISSASYLKTLDLSGCTQLTSLYLYFEWVLTDLDLTNCTALETVTIRKCYDLKKLDLTNCTALETVTIEDCRDLMALDLTPCAALKQVTIQNMSNLTSVDFSTCAALQKLKLERISYLISLNLSNCAALEALSVRYCRAIRTLDLHDLKALIQVTCESNSGLTTLNVSGCTALPALDCQGNRSLTTLNASGCTALKELDCGYTGLTSLNLSGCAALEQLDCGYTGLTSLNLSGCAALEKLECYYDALTSLDLRSCTALKELWCGGNRKLTSLNLSKCAALETLNCVETGLTSLDLSGCTALKTVYCNYNKSLTALKLGSLPQLGWLECEDTALTALDVSKCPSLDYLWCYDTPLTALNASGCAALYNLDITRTKLPGLPDLRKCANLKELGCIGNGWTSLDLSMVPSLSYLYCYGNAFTTLDVSPCVALNYTASKYASEGLNPSQSSSNGYEYDYYSYSENYTRGQLYVDRGVTLISKWNPFGDVKEGKFYYDAVIWAYYNRPYQITAGTDAAHFSPNAVCTRAQVVTFLWRAKGCPEPVTTTCSFTDVKTTGFYYKAMLWAVEMGITTGTSATTFGPGKACTRGQVVAFLWRAEGCPEPVTTTCNFTDVKTSGFYYKAMLWAVENGITNGTSETTFGPSKTCTRGQVVSFLMRDIERS